MIKKLFGLTLMAAMFVSCGTSTDKNEAAETEKEIAKVEFASLIEDPAEFEGKEISLEGKVVHVCKHSGKKMFIVGENPDIRLFISAGEEVAKFPMELQGSIVAVTGKLAKVEVGEKHGEGEHKEGEHKEGEGKEGEAEEGEACETEAAIAAQPVLADYVLHYASHTEK